MENASKALIMAGGLLIAIMILSVVVYVFGIVGDQSKQTDTIKAQEQLAKFNREYESYQRQVLRGSDIVTIVNKIEDNNKRFPYQEIIWEMIIPETISSLTVLEPGAYSNITQGLKRTDLKFNGNSTDVTEFKRLYFKCTGIEYSSIGRVNKIKFLGYNVEEKYFNTTD